MSCIRFSTDAMREQLRSVPAELREAKVVTGAAAPPVTESKIRRLRLLAGDPDPRIRASAASSHHAPADLLLQLARDAEVGVRTWVARNQAAPADVLRVLAGDTDETVRGWVALNESTPSEVVTALGEDPSTTVRSIVAWRASV
ncbi:hypothetical protein [Desertihabitans aurantiacus]|uniref:hypothetical protein n=1 Tax=Desertihabitans aurantiacus TaxID=2282477 RepID=UPI000DF77BDF|nr:hypothetical protein [Desertihabitans aurantiacus]